eukprot:1539424-Pleurochrysis_carterae.AAC.1
MNTARHTMRGEDRVGLQLQGERTGYRETERVMGVKLCTGLTGFGYRESELGYRELGERNCAQDT